MGCQGCNQGRTRVPIRQIGFGGFGSDILWGGAAPTGQIGYTLPTGYVPQGVPFFAPPGVASVPTGVGALTQLTGSCNSCCTGGVACVCTGSMVNLSGGTYVFPAGAYPIPTGGLTCRITVSGAGAPLGACANNQSFQLTNHHVGADIGNSTCYPYGGEYVTAWYNYPLFTGGAFGTENTSLNFCATGAGGGLVSGCWQVILYCCCPNFPVELDVYGPCDAGFNSAYAFMSPYWGNLTISWNPFHINAFIAGSLPGYRAGTGFTECITTFDITVTS
jgi:hypothetical protein